MNRALVSTLSALLMSACISGEGEAPTGGAQVLPGAPAPIADYDEGAGGMAGTGLAPLPGQDPFPTTTAGAAPAPATPSGTAGAAGTDAAGAGAPTAGTDGAPPPTGTTPTDPAIDPAIDTPQLPGDTGTTAPAPAPTGTPGKLVLDFTTVDLRGRYAPRNVGAVWVEGGSGGFIKTLARWAGIRANHLSQWNLASGGWFSFFGIGATPDELDAITAATLRSHQAHHIEWDMIDNNEAVVADGAYNIVIEVTDDEIRPSVSMRVPFDKGSMPVSVSIPNESPVSNLSLTYTP